MTTTSPSPPGPSSRPPCDTLKDSTRESDASLRRVDSMRDDSAIARKSPTEPPHSATSALHPQLAVILGVNRKWHIPLFLCRALATVPPVIWFARCSVLFLRLVRSSLGQGGTAGSGEAVDGLLITEIFLAMLWCTASAYLSFFFADCLMSRWLLNYTPSATLVRLLTISSINMYTTSWWVYLSGGTKNPRLLLPAWICIASTLTILYHITHRHVNIRRETRAAVRAFWLSSFISLLLLLMQLHLSRATYQSIPLVDKARRVGYIVAHYIDGEV